MTVQILTPAQKAAVVTIYTSSIKPASIKYLALCLDVSATTISRVIQEAGIKASKKTHTVQEASAVMSLLYKHKVTIQQLELMLTTTEVKQKECASPKYNFPIPKSHQLALVLH